MNANLPEKDDYYAKLINEYVDISTKIESNAQDIKEHRKNFLNFLRVRTLKIKK